MTSDVSVIIPCYNDGLYITNAVDSALNQTLLPKKIFIIDDGSSRSTREVLQSIDHPLVEVIYCQNEGVSTARNKGIGLTTTEWILTLDADDYFESTFLEKAFDVLRTTPNTSIVSSFYKKFGDSASTNIIRPTGGTIKNFLVRNNGIASALFKKKCWVDVNGYDTQFDKGYEDWDFWISVLAKGYNMHIIPEVLFNYRIKPNSRDHNAVRNHDVSLRRKLYKKHKKVYIENIDSVMDQMIHTNAHLKNTILKRENSLDYRLGKAMLAPLRWIKRICLRESI